MRARRRGWAAVLAAGAAGVAALGPVLLGTALPAGASTTWDIAAVNKTFSPNYRNIKPGDRVLWTNQDDKITHSVTSDKGNTVFDEDLGKRGATFERRFDTPGTYTYHCKYHSSMVGTIDVGTPPTTTTTTAPPTTTTTAPATTTTAEPTTTTTAPRPAAGPGPVPAPPVPSSAQAAPLPPSSTTTTAPSTTTTTTVPPTTATSAPPAPAGGDAPAPPAPGATPPTSAGKAGDTGGKIPTAAGPPAAPGGDLDVGAIALVSALVAVGAFAAWTLIRVRPGRI